MSDGNDRTTSRPIILPNGCLDPVCPPPNAVIHLPIRAHQNATLLTTQQQALTTLTTLMHEHAAINTDPAIKQQYADAAAQLESLMSELTA